MTPSMNLSRVFALVALFAASAAAQAVPWPHPDGTTHWYEAVPAGTVATWLEAEADAVLRGGHLATVTSSEENDFVFQLVSDPSWWVGSLGPWLGGLQGPAATEPAGGWGWVERTLDVYANWSTGQPDDAGGLEHHLAFGDGIGIAPTWSDVDATAMESRAYVIEWTGRPSDQTVGLFRKQAEAFGGYVLLAPTRGDSIVRLVDGDGRVAHEWDTDIDDGLSTYLLDDGGLLRACSIAGGLMWNGIFVGGLTGRVERHDWDGNLLWSYEIATNDHHLHHDVEMLPNGNVLMIVYERKDVNEAFAAGRDLELLTDGELWPDVIIEVDPDAPGGPTIVWEWKVWDHLVQDVYPGQANYGVVEDHPELIDINFVLNGGADWTHINTIDYNPALDQIMLTVHSLSEIWVIDHSTTTAEAAGHTGGNSGRGGDILYRWGNPQSYGAGTAADQQLWRPHDAQWIPPGLPGAGNILVYDNGFGRPDGNFSRVLEFTPPPTDAQGVYPHTAGTAYLPATTTWHYEAPNRTDFFSRVMSGCMRLPNGNTFICAAVPGDLFEVTPDGRTVWEYRNPIDGPALLFQGDLGNPCNPLGTCTPVFNAHVYDANHPGLVGRDLAPAALIEQYPPEIEARFGSMNSGNDSVVDVLSVNGDVGDVWREVYVDSMAPVNLDMAVPPGGPIPAHFVLYITPGAPTIADMHTLPGEVGTSAIPLPLHPSFLQPPHACLANTLPGSDILGVPILPGISPAPTSFVGVPIPAGTYTIQGLMMDLSPGPGFRVTNAVVLHVL